MPNAKKIWVLAAWLLNLPLVASAADWTGKGELGVALSDAASGASTTTVAGKIDVATETEQWKHAAGGSIVYNKAKAEATPDDPNPEENTTAKRWEAHEQSDYKFTPRAFWFGAARYEDDDIGSFAYQAVLSTGVGYQFIDGEETKLAGQVGVGYKRFKVNSTGETDNEAIVTGALTLEQVLTSNTRLINKLAVESGSSNTLIVNDLALQVKMSDVLSLAAGHQVRYNTDPAPRKVGPGTYAHSDRLLTLNLVYEFK